MSIVIIGITLWAIGKIISNGQQRAKARARQRAIEAQRRQAAEAARLREEWRQEQARARAAAAWRREIEREQQRQAREQERQAKEQARIAKEQERQAAQLAKHEEQLAKLEHKRELAEREIEHYTPLLEDLQREVNALAYKVQYYDSIGLPCSGTKDKLEKARERAYRMESKIIKAEFIRDEALQKISA